MAGTVFNDVKRKLSAGTGGDARDGLPVDFGGFGLAAAQKRADIHNPAEASALLHERCVDGGVDEQIGIGDQHDGFTEHMAGAGPARPAAVSSRHSA